MDRGAWLATVHGITKSQTQLKWLRTHTSSGKCFVALLYKASEQMKVGQSSLTLCDPRTVVCQASLSLGFSRQEYQSGLPFPALQDLPNPGTEPRYPVLAGGVFTVWATREVLFYRSYWSNLFLLIFTDFFGASQVAQWWRIPLPSRIHGFGLWVGKIPRQSSLVVYSRWGCKESDTT